MCKADTALMALLPASQSLYLDASPETDKTLPRIVIRHSTTSPKYTQPSVSGGTRMRTDETTFEFVAHGDDLPVLSQISDRLMAIFDAKPFSLIDKDGHAVTTAKVSSCLSVPGGNIESLPTPNTQQKSVHRLRLRFRAIVGRSL